jgi:nucleotide-binding universal stress UspA family protein
VSFGALDAAAAEAQRRTADLEVVYSVADLDEAGPVLRAAAARVAHRHPGLAVITTAAVGNPADALVERGRGATLTVVASRGIGGCAGLLLHSVGQQVAARTAVPLLVVRGNDVRRTTQRSRTGGVLLGLESDADADAALFAFEEAQLRGARLDVLHAWTYQPTPAETPDPYPAEPVRERIVRHARAEAALPDEVVAPPRGTYPRLAVETRSTPSRALIAATADADLVVIAAHRRRTRLGIQLGPVTGTLLHHAQCPVAIVPIPEG